MRSWGKEKRRSLHTRPAEETTNGATTLPTNQYASVNMERNRCLICPSDT
jgi:hypothetical protein